MTGDQIARLLDTLGAAALERTTALDAQRPGADALPGPAACTAAQAQRFIERLAESGVELGVDKAAAVRGVLTSGARIESLVGPAGTGKTSSLA
jgi:hypothetical protein